MVKQHQNENKTFFNRIRTALVALTALAVVVSAFVFSASDVNATTSPSVSYRGHVQSYGWQDWVSDGASAGTTGQSKRLEAIYIEQPTNVDDVSGGLRYRSHVQSYGWQNWVTQGQMTGTTGKGKRLEAIQIELTGNLASKYDIYYRTHCQSFGWLGWAKNGAISGTVDHCKRVEAIQIKIVPKGSAAPGSTNNAYIQPIPLQKIWIDTNNFSLTVGKSYKLPMIYTPANASNKTLSWTSSNNAVATVSSNGTVTAKSAGEAVITCKHGSLIDKVRVYVKNSAPSSTPQYIDTTAAYTELNKFRQTPGIWYWNSNNTTKTYFNKSGYTTLKPLKRSVELETIAKQRVKEISVDCSHTRPNGKVFWYETYANFDPICENIAYGSGDLSWVMGFWTEADKYYAGQGHRRGMLTTDADSVGIACGKVGNYYYWVQCYGDYY